MYSITEYEFLADSSNPRAPYKITDLVSVKVLPGEDYADEVSAHVRCQELYQRSRENESLLRYDYDYHLKAEGSMKLINALDRSYASLVETNTGDIVNQVYGLWALADCVQITYATDVDVKLYTHPGSLLDLVEYMCSATFAPLNAELIKELDRAYTGVIWNFDYTTPFHILGVEEVPSNIIHVTYVSDTWDYEIFTWYGSMLSLLEEMCQEDYHEFTL